VTCRSCGAVIAEKAIVCYRCGAPTAAEPPPVRPATSRGPALWLLVLLVAGIAGAGWMAAQTSVVLTRVIWIAVAVLLAVPVLVGVLVRRPRR
jgi:hypothetical protein